MGEPSTPRRKLKIEDLEQREEHWAIVDLVGKGGHVRTVPMPQWVKNAIDRWTASAGIASGPIFRPVNKAGGELEQIQFLLGHISVQTTERYLGCKQRFRNAVNDRPGIEPELPAG